MDWYRSIETFIEWFQHCAQYCSHWLSPLEVSKSYFSKKYKSPERSQNNPVSGVIEWLRQARPDDVQENKISQNLRKYKRLTKQALIFNVDSARSQQYLSFEGFQHILLSCLPVFPKIFNNYKHYSSQTEHVLEASWRERRFL